jgi:hypothetical protein
MGFVFFRERTILRKSIMVKAARTAKRLHEAKGQGRGYYLKHIRAMLSYMGWFNCTDTYACYEQYIKPYVKIKKLKNIVSKEDRRKNHEAMEQRTLLAAA